MTWQLMEAAIDAVKDVLTGNISAKVTELNTRYGDSVTLADVVSDSIYHGEPTQIQNPPALLVVPGVSRDPQVLGGGGDIKLSHNVDVICFALGQLGADDLTRRVERYALGVLEIVRDNRPLSGYSVFWGDPLVEVRALLSSRTSPGSEFALDSIVSLKLSKMEVST